jgi:hypothetical protein
MMVHYTNVCHTCSSDRRDSTHSLFSDNTFCFVALYHTLLIVMARVRRSATMPGLIARVPDYCHRMEAKAARIIEGVYEFTPQMHSTCPHTNFVQQHYHQLIVVSTEVHGGSS